jgi:Putative peptidoglycan binding domain
MKRLWVVGLLVATICAAWAAPLRPRQAKTKPAAIVPHGPRRPTSRSEAAEQAHTGHIGKVTVRRVRVRQMVRGHWVNVSRVVRVKQVPVVPPHPDADRLKEIQKALSDKGYFKGEVNGVWNADSVAALKQFQTEKNLPAADGKISALSLIGLGLGPRHDGSVAALPSAMEKPQQNIPQ